MNPSPARPRDAKFIVIEGIDGAGTTTQGQDLSEYLQRKTDQRNSRPTVFTKEPSRGPVGAMIQLALAGRVTGHVLNGGEKDLPASDDEPATSTRIDSRTMALLFAADRIDHIKAEIEPNLDEGRTVVSDRYLMSTLAYQGLHLERDWLLEINRYALTPDLTLFLDVDVTKARTRFRSTRWSSDLYEGIAEQRRVRDQYHDLMVANISELGPIARVDASPSRRVVRQSIRRIVDIFLETGSLEANAPVETLFQPLEQLRECQRCRSSLVVVRRARDEDAVWVECPRCGSSPRKVDGMDWNLAGLG